MPMEWLFDDPVKIVLSGLLAVLAIGASAILLCQRERLACAARIRQSQAERRRALRLLAAIVGGSEDAIFALDREGHFILFNRAAERITRKTEPEVIGRDETAVFPPELARRLIADNPRVIESGTTDELGAVLEVIRQTGALDATRAAAASQAQLAIDALQQFPANAYTEGLLQLAAQLLERRL